MKEAKDKAEKRNRGSQEGRKVDIYLPIGWREGCEDSFCHLIRIR
jgi:hypothetical protein